MNSVTVDALFGFWRGEKVVDINVESWDMYLEPLELFYHTFIYSASMFDPVCFHYVM
jgi:hypothetical protein